MNDQNPNSEQQRAGEQPDGPPNPTPAETNSAGTGGEPMPPGEPMPSDEFDDGFGDEQTSGFADPEDAMVARDDAGEKIPQVIHLEGFGKVEYIPASYGDVQKYFGDGSQHEVEEEAMAHIFERFIERPDFSSAADEWATKMGHRPRGRVTKEYVEDMKPLMVRELLMGLFDASGIDANVMMEGTTAKVDVSEGN